MTVWRVPTHCSGRSGGGGSIKMSQDTILPPPLQCVRTEDLYVGDEEKRTQKKKRFRFLLKNTANHKSGIYIAAKSSLCLIQKLAKC
ncbi:Uncharacterized protein FWK35_00017899 [Aphis craccivora]|uniref:Uncharacterized protein n=1 Tax=Aphis craccivora TaxID=307492 RepID=A0A6G0YPN8_APHCR|nr:Uncharacterized protein FWK35_00017899 [Aphis craccivora]